MKDVRDENGNLLPYELRITKFGNMLRSSSLDELPELINILKGDLSFVGPRPLVAAYLPLYTKYERQRLNVRGGLIPPEVLYKNVTPTWEQQFEYEVNYALNVSFLLDLKIITATFKSLFKRNTINYGNYNRDSFFEKRFQEEREYQQNQERENQEFKNEENLNNVNQNEECLRKELVNDKNLE